MKRIFLSIGHDIQGSDYYRKILPYQHCKDDLAKEGIELEISAKLDATRFYDAILISNIVEPYTLTHLFARVVQGHSRIFWDIDDNYWRIPEHHPLKMGIVQFDCLMAAMGMSTRMSVSTSRLRDFVMQGTSDRIPLVLPNLVDLKDWQGEIEPNQNRKPKDIIIAWAGTNTHDQDLLTILPTLKEVCKGNVKFLVFGDIPEKIAFELGNNVLQQKWVPVKKYPETLRSWKPNIAVCPLLDNEFNNAKTCCKVLEMVNAGACVITSPVGEYKELIDFLLYLEEDDIGELIEDEKFRLAEHANQLESVQREWSWQNANRKNVWLDYFRMMVN